MKPVVPARILVLVGATAALAASAILASWQRPLSQDFWFWLAACVVGELLWVRLPLGQATASMASCFHYAGLLVLPRGEAMAIAAASSVIGESLFMRKPVLRVLFNAGQVALAVGAASVCFATIRGGAKLPDLIYGLRLLPLVAAAVAYFLVNKGAVSAAVALSERVSLARAWRVNFGGHYELLSNGALFSLGALLASHYSVNGVVGTLLLVLPLLVAHEGYQRYARRRSDIPRAGESQRRAA